MFGSMNSVTTFLVNCTLYCHIFLEYINIDGFHWEEVSQKLASKIMLLSELYLICYLNSYEEISPSVYHCFLSRFAENTSWGSTPIIYPLSSFILIDLRIPEYLS